MARTKLTTPVDDINVNDDFDIEVECLLQALFLKRGYDFREYSRQSLRRRVSRYMIESSFKRIADLQHAIIHDERTWLGFLCSLTINVTDFFRDPEFFEALRHHVIPELKSYPFVKIWLAGCSTGEEAYSISILLQECGLGERAVIYATDINPQVIEQARRGIYHEKQWATADANYAASGAAGKLTDYVSKGYGHFIVDPVLRKNIVFTQHDLVIDQCFGEMQLIICRNVLIYFRRELQNKVLGLFHQSLDLGGFLGLGLKETLMSFSDRQCYRALSGSTKIYQRVE